MIIKPTFTCRLIHPDLGTYTPPIESFSARLREGDQDSYLQVTIPDYYRYSSNLLPYIDHCRAPRLAVYKHIHPTSISGPTSIATATTTTIANVTLESMALENGSKSDSIVLSGHRAYWNTSPASVTITGIDYEKRGFTSEYDSSYRIRCSVTNNVFPSDTVTYDNGNTVYTFIATLISINNFDMEIASD